MLRGWMFYAGVSVVSVGLATYLTSFHAPGAAGSGNAELIAYLNGVNYPKLIGFNTLVVKIVGVTLAVIGGLCVGKEGPLAHIGANVGAAIAYFPLCRFDYLRNDKHKRELIAAGCSAGVSAAFGAPIGGALFAYELSKPNDFWKFSVLWKSFVACSTAVFWTAIFHQALLGRPTINVTPAELKFGGVAVESPTIDSIPCAIIVGIVCGLLGAVFVVVNSKLFKLRKKHITTACYHVIEGVLFALATSSAFFWAPKIFNDCKPNADIQERYQELLLQYDCKDGEHSPLGSMLFNEELGAIRSILSGYESSGGILLPAT